MYRFLLPSRSILYFCCLLRQTETVLDSLMSLIRFLLCSQYTVSWRTGILHQKTHFHLLVEVVLRPYTDILRRSCQRSWLMWGTGCVYICISEERSAADTTSASFGEPSPQGEHIPQSCLLKEVATLPAWQHFWQHSNCRSCRQAVFLWKILSGNDGFS